MFAQVAVPLRLPSLTYRAPPELGLAIGDAVVVRVRNKKISGVITELMAEAPANITFELKSIEGRASDFPSLLPGTLSILRWAATYYHCPLGEVLRGFLPPEPKPPSRESWRISPAGAERLARGEGVRGKNQIALLARLGTEPGSSLVSEERAAARKLLTEGWLERSEEEDTRLPADTPAAPNPVALNLDQAKALEDLRASLDRRAFETFLLQGVTGSGKTEVYLRAAAHTLAGGRSVLVVVPEIALTPQLLQRFRSRLGVPIALLHSGVSDGERSRQWHQLNRGHYRVCLGARSASFAPMRDLGLVVVDEEHDSALKQEDHLRYNARDLAIMRGKLDGATVLLGSATPSLETFHNARQGRYRHLLLPERATGSRMPDVTVVDQSRSSATGSLTPELKREIDRTLASGGQVMLLLNRRGYSSFLLCEACGFVPQCPNCSVSLTNYRAAGRLKCHYCGHQEPLPKACAQCQNPAFRTGTLGTESLEEEVQGIYPDRRVIRIDRESVERKGALESALQSIASGEAEIIIGTQIIAKGHDFPNISLVGVVNADSAFHLPDFRAAEKSFQLFTQMAGRAGRGDTPGKVIIQTYNPQHPSIVHSMRHDYRGFSEEELRIRHDFGYPPFCRMARIVFSGPTEALAEKAAEKATAFLQRSVWAKELEIVGPAPAALTKVQNRFRWNLLIKAKKAGPLHAALSALVAADTHVKGESRVVLQIDVDPVSLM